MSLKKRTVMNIKADVYKRQVLKLRSKLCKLTERERYIIKLRYGLIGGEEVTQREIAGMLGISRSYVSRLSLIHI